MTDCPHGGRRPAPPRPGEVVGTYRHCADLECPCGEARADALLAALPPGTIRQTPPAHIIARLRAGFSDHGYATRLMEEAADRIEAMQNAGAAMARRLDELEPGPFGDDVEEELETIATGTVSAGLLRLELEGPPPPDGTRVAVIIIPDTIDVVPT